MSLLYPKGTPSTTLCSDQGSDISRWKSRLSWGWSTAFIGSTPQEPVKWISFCHFSYLFLLESGKWASGDKPKPMLTLRSLWPLLTWTCYAYPRPYTSLLAFHIFPSTLSAHVIPVCRLPCFSLFQKDILVCWAPLCPREGTMATLNSHKCLWLFSLSYLQ